jgi:hypothetical protein
MGFAPLNPSYDTESDAHPLGGEIACDATHGAVHGKALDAAVLARRQQRALVVVELDLAAVDRAATSLPKGPKRRLRSSAAALAKFPPVRLVCSRTDACLSIRRRLAPRSSRLNVEAVCVAGDVAPTPPRASSLPSSHPVSSQVFWRLRSSGDRTAVTPSCWMRTVFFVGVKDTGSPRATAARTCATTSGLRLEPTLVIPVKAGIQRRSWRNAGPRLTLG